MRRQKKIMKLLLATALLTGLVGFLLHGSVLQAPSSNTWAPTPGAMVEARSGAAAAALADGRVLISGGEGAAGSVASAETFNLDGSFSPVAPMSFARSRHAAVTLKDGRVLVAGGVTADSSATNSAEIFDPASGAWQAAGAMLEARAGATTTLLSDGRVVIAGGENSGVASQTLEVFDPVSDSFLPAGMLSSPRMDHAAALLAEDRILLVGGSDGNVSLATSEIWDAATEQIVAGPAMSVARKGLSATTLIDGKVLLAGGSDGSSDLATTELFDPAAVTVAPGPAMAAPRAGHLAFLLPHNNAVLFVGGGAAAGASAELYQSWTGSFVSTGAMSAARALASGSAPKGTDGILLVAGGKDSNGALLASGEVYGFATIKTDADDYPPMTQVFMTGSGWEAGELVNLTLHETGIPDPDPDIMLTVTADASGNISESSFYTDPHDAGVRFYLTAVGERSQAQTTFTDASVSVTCATNPVGVGSATVCTYSLSGNPSGNATWTWNTANTTNFTAAAPFSFTPPNQCTLSGTGTKTCAVTYTPTAQGSQTIAAVNGANSASFALTVYGTATQYLVTSSDNNPVAGTTVTITAQLADSGGTPVPTAGKVVTWSRTNGGSFLSSTSTTNANGIATVLFTTNTVAGTVHTVTATDNTSVTGTSGNITTVVGPLDHLAFLQQPTNTIASQTITPPVTVQEMDANNNVLTGDGTTHITIAISNNPGCPANCGTLTGSTNVVVSGGVATFSNLSINIAGNGYTLAAHGPGNAQGTSDPFNIDPSTVSTTTTVASSANPSTYGDDVTFTAVTSPASGTNTPTGSIAFVIDGGGPVAGTASACPISAPAHSLCATYSTATLKHLTLPHTVSATYTPDTASFNSSSGSLSGGQVVNAFALTVTGITANNKEYDGNDTATLTTTGYVLHTLVGSDDVTLDDSSYSAHFNDKTVANNKPVTVTGLKLGGADADNYTLTQPTGLTANITPKALTVAGITVNTKDYDGNDTATLDTSSAVLHDPVTGDSVSLDASSYSAHFDNRNAGTGKSVTVSGLKLSGGDAGNYTLTQPTGLTGTIKPLAIDVTAVNDTKTYDGNTTSTGIPTVAPAVISPDTADFTQAFDNRNAGVGNKTLIPSGSVNDGNGGNNYAVTFHNFTTGTINPRPITVTAQTNTKYYDGNASAAALPVVTSALSPAIVAGDTADFSETYDNANHGTAKTLTASGSVNDGNSGNNYAVTFVADHTGVINPATTTTGVTSSKNPSTVGESVTFTATVTNTVTSPVPTGSVQFKVDGSNFGAPVGLDGTGKATLTTTTLSAGTHTVSAYYTSADGNFADSNGPLAGGQLVTFNFAGLFDPYAPPSVRAFKVKSAIPLKWQYTDVNSNVVPSPNADPRVKILALGACGDTSGDAILVDDAGTSGYQYDSLTNTWQFNWKTTGQQAGCYLISIHSNLTGQDNGSFPIQLKK